MQHSANYLRAYSRNTYSCARMAEYHVLGLGHPGSTFRNVSDPPPVLARSPVGACRRRVDPGHPKPFSDVSFWIFAFILLPPPLRFPLPLLFFIILKNV